MFHCLPKVLENKKNAKKNFTLLGSHAHKFNAISIVFYCINVAGKSLNLRQPHKGRYTGHTSSQRISLSPSVGHGLPAHPPEPLHRGHRLQLPDLRQGEPLQEGRLQAQVGLPQRPVQAGVHQPAAVRALRQGLRVPQGRLDETDPQPDWLREAVQLQGVQAGERPPGGGLLGLLALLGGAVDGHHGHHHRHRDAHLPLDLPDGGVRGHPQSLLGILLHDALGRRDNSGEVLGIGEKLFSLLINKYIFRFNIDISGMMSSIHLYYI